MGKDSLTECVRTRCVRTRCERTWCVRTRCVSTAPHRSLPPRSPHAAPRSPHARRWRRGPGDGGAGPGPARRGSASRGLSEPPADQRPLFMGMLRDTSVMKGISMPDFHAQIPSCCSWRAVSDKVRGFSLAGGAGGFCCSARPADDGIETCAAPKSPQSSPLALEGAGSPCAAWQGLLCSSQHRR